MVINSFTTCVKKKFHQYARAINDWSQLCLRHWLSPGYIALFCRVGSFPLMFWHSTRPTMDFSYESFLTFEETPWQRKFFWWFPSWRILPIDIQIRCFTPNPAWLKMTGVSQGNRLKSRSIWRYIWSIELVGIVFRNCCLTLPWQYFSRYNPGA